MTTQPTMHRLRPMYGYATVLESGVDEEQRDSGLIVPVGTEQTVLRRGVILHVSDAGGDYSDKLPAGTVVYYRGGIRIADVVLVDIADEIVAYEEEP